MSLKRRSGKDSGGSGENKTIICENLVEGQEYEARLVYVADLGLHDGSFGNDVKPDVQKIALGYEILGETVEIDGEKAPRMIWDKPFNIYWKMDERGNEYAAYKVFKPTAKAGEIADWDGVLGTPVNVTVKHVSDKKDPTIKYDNIASVQAIPKKYQKDVPAATIEPCVGDADDPTNEATKNLYGLTKWFYDRRRVEGETPEPNDSDNSVSDDYIPF